MYNKNLINLQKKILKFHTIDEYSSNFFNKTFCQIKLAASTCNSY